MKKRILLLAPPYMDLYKDIISCLESKDYDVVWVSDGCILGNPYNKSNITRHTKTIEQYQTEVDAFWDKQFSKDEFKASFDYFLAIDGFMVTPTLFNTLKKQNPAIRTVLYLYDRVEGNYEIDIFFKYYTSIFSFDLCDCAHYGLKHLPIYWVPSDKKVAEEYDIFGLASYSSAHRFAVYRSIKNLCIQNGLKDYIKLYYRPAANNLLYFIKYIWSKMYGKEILSPNDLKDDIFTSISLPPHEFRELILKSKVILDTQNCNQDGMTARFMWALGAGKKIITTNKAAKINPFYTKEQIFILNEDNIDGIPDFIKREFVATKELRSIIGQYRIDNWIDSLLNARN